MRWTQVHVGTDECGAAAIELLFAIPLVLVFAAGILDLSTYIERNITLDLATTAAVRYCMDDPSRIQDEASIREYLGKVEPSLGSFGMRITQGSSYKQKYTHLFFIDESESALKRTSYCSYQRFKIELSYKSEFKTLVGKSISLACGGDGSLTASNSKSGSLDKTDGDTW